MRKIQYRRLLLLCLAFAIPLTAFGCQTGTDPNPNPNPAGPSPTIQATPLPALTPQPEPEDPAELITYQVSRAFSSNMVVQRNQYVTVWGWADQPGGILYGDFMGETRYAVVGADGNWKMQFSPHPETAEPQTMRIKPIQGEETVFDNILVGDVWIVSGQSNAELQLTPTIAYLEKEQQSALKDEIKADSQIRIFTQTRTHVISDPAYYSAPQKDVTNPRWRWQVGCERGAYGNFSAIGYYFAMELRKNLPEVPIGMIMAAAGGACLRELLPAETANELGYSDTVTVPVGGYYNSLISPFVGLPFTGMLFYQGESEAAGDMYRNYARDLKAFVEELRTRWQYDFPFYNVQLSSHGENQLSYWPQLPEIRNAQYQALSIIPNSYLAVSMDVGFREDEDDWAHPKNKNPVGQRLGRLALATIYGKLSADDVCSPQPAEVTWESDAVLIRFAHAGEGLKLMEGTELKGFQCVYNGTAEAAAAEVVDSRTVKVRLSKEGVSAVRYGMIPLAYPENANLCSSGGYPAAAFEWMK